jgi:release factor glutamine methyltransferase
VTIHARVAAARDRLRAAGIAADEASLDARILAEHLLGWDAARYFASGADAEPPAFAAAYDALVARRAAREPLAYITGSQQFWDLTFEVTPAVLIPRPETELVVETVLERFPRHAPFAFADACTGSGCLAVAVAAERLAARAVATDASPDALAVAARNARRHGVDGRVRLVCADVLSGVAGPFDLITANPPYVAAADRAALPPEVRDHEPALALFGGADGLDVVRRVIGQAADRLSAGGMLVMEIGAGQDEPVAKLISAAPRLRMVHVRRDLQDIPRTVVAQRD